MIFLVLSGIVSAQESMLQKAYNCVGQFCETVKPIGRVVTAMPYVLEQYTDVRLIYNDPEITTFGAYQPASKDGQYIPGEQRATDWEPSITKKAAGSPVFVNEYKFIQQDKYSPENFNQLKEEITKFIRDEFQNIVTDNPYYQYLIDEARSSPMYLSGHSFGGLLTLKLATNADFLDKTQGLIQGFIAEAPETYSRLNWGDYDDTTLYTNELKYT
jgi:hypothetical protein